MFDFIQKDFKNVVVGQEESIGTMVRAIGNGNAENMILVGTDMSGRMSEKTRKESAESFQMVDGRWDDLKDPKYENPVIITADKARTLGVKRFDILRIRLRNIFGQNQSARLTVIGTMKTSNIFMGAVTFGEMQNVKTILGFDSHSTGNFNLTLKHPEKNARLLADAVHRRLNTSGVAVIAGIAEAHGRKRTATVLGFNSDPDLQSKWAGQLDLISGNLEKIRLDKTALVAQPLARALGVGPGSSFNVQYADKWGIPGAYVLIQVGGIFRPAKIWGPQVILLQDERFYEAFYGHWPQPAAQVAGAFIPGKDHPAYALLSPEWIFLPRTRHHG